MEENRKLDLNQFATDQLIEWRNSSSKKVNENDKAIDSLMEEMDRYERLNRKALKWIAKLNRVINKRAFGYKKQIYKASWERS